jgi:hypothetical protein
MRNLEKIAHFIKKVLKLYHAMIYVNKNKVAINASEKCGIISSGPNLKAVCTLAKSTAILPVVSCPMMEA